MLEAAVAAGVAAAGGEALLGGVLPTPGAPLLIDRYGFDLAAVLSASHNPYQDNGIKFFGGDGFKLSDATEAEIEARMAAPAPAPRIGRVRRFHGALEDYLRALHERFAELDLSGRRVAARLRQRRHLRGRAGDLPPPRRPRRRARRRARRAQHQRRLRLDAPRRAARGDGRGRPRRRLRVRRRRRPRAGRRPHRRGRRRRRADRARRPAPRRRPAWRGDGDDQLRLPRRDGARRASRSPPPTSATATCSRRCASAAGRSAASSPATSSTWASCPPATASPRRCWRSRRSRAATCTTAHAMEKLPQTLVNVRVRDRGALDGAAERPRGGRARVGRARGPRPGAAAPERHRAARARDGRGADGRRGGKRLLPARRARRAELT